ncbi:hypothetical protein [Micromonospora sp. GCM10011541]|uniref:hypothetical protein n=1 Tax=Micromonospora sp. GCM10011541 TaxID=3317336 RepID=UPI003605B59E
MKTKLRHWVAVIAAVTLLGAAEGVANRALDIDPAAPPAPAQVVELVQVAEEPAVRAPIEGLPECPTEDSEGPCNWYGGSNGEGLRFAALPETGEPVPADMAEFLAEEPGQGDRDWSVCTWYVGDTSWIVCPDGYSLSS